MRCIYWLRRVGASERGISIVEYVAITAISLIAAGFIMARVTSQRFVIGSAMANVLSTLVTSFESGHNSTIDQDFSGTVRRQAVIGRVSNAQSSAGEASAGDTSAGETSTGTASAGEASAGDASAGEASAGDTSAGLESNGLASIAEGSLGLASTSQPARSQPSFGRSSSALVLGLTQALAPYMPDAGAPGYGAALLGLAGVALGATRGWPNRITRPGAGAGTTLAVPGFLAGYGAGRTPATIALSFGVVSPPIWVALLAGTIVGTATALLGTLAGNRAAQRSRGTYLARNLAIGGVLGLAGALASATGPIGLVIAGIAVGLSPVVLARMRSRGR
jgi:hypothetical protein